MFIDTANIHVKAGNGGNGAVSFRREKFVPAGGPDGGDGGKGGNILFLASKGRSTLASFRHKRKFVADNGEDGGSKRCFGKSGEDIVIKVPAGTLIFEKETNRLIADVSGDEPIVLLKGGNGGWGNSHFATPTRQAPDFAKPGALGASFNLKIELRLLADVGLVGFPNVGKSSLLSVVSQAKPQVANYHFTTLSPVLGVVTVADDVSFVMADIPGLIEGASEGVGLGHDFLRHIHRCRILVHMIDVSGSEGRDPIEDFRTINEELKAYDKDILEKPMIVVGNKCDLTDKDTIAKVKTEIESLGYDFFPVMAPISQGTKPLVQRLAAMLAKMPMPKPYEPEPEIVKEEPLFTISHDEGVFVVKSDHFVNILQSVDVDSYDSLHYFQRLLVSAGVIEALEKKGVSEGDTVRIGDFEFDFIK